MKMIIPVQIKEEKYYSKFQLLNKLSCNYDKLNPILDKLNRNNIINIKVNENSEECIKFVFVGVLIIENFVIYCYPKYATKCEFDDLKQIIKVIERFKNDDDIVHIQNDINNNESINMLPLMLFFIKDYYEHGLYNNYQEIIEHNGDGEILWQKTIDYDQVLIQDNRPYYYDLITRNRTNDLKNYFRTLHKIIITKCSKDLEKANLLNLFDLSKIELSDETLESFDDKNNILNMINHEWHSQFNTRKIELLEAMKLFILNKSSNIGLNNCFSLYGTTSFYHVWEKVCCHVLNDVKDTPLKNIPLPKELNEKYMDNTDLMSLIEKPSWNILEREPKLKSTLEPDLITITEKEGRYTFYILDAKYYNIEYNKKLDNQPGIESITKQYLYHLAFKEFIELHDFDWAKNCFLFPSDSSNMKNIGFVELKMLNNFSLAEIQVILLPAKKVYQKFLENKSLDITDLKLN